MGEAKPFEDRRISAPHGAPVRVRNRDNGGPLPRYDEVMGQLYIQVLRPLCWAGLLQQERGAASFRFEEAVFMKTPLWRSAGSSPEKRISTSGANTG